MNMMISMAWRNIWRNKMRSVVIMISIALGLVAGLFIMGLYEGVLNDRLNTVIRQEVAHVQVHHPRFQKDYEAVFRLDSASRLVERIRALENVQAVSARTVAPGMLATSTGSAGVQILGVVPVDEDAVSGLKQKLIEGEGFTANRHNQVMIGRKLADKVNLRLNSKLVLSFTDSENNLVSAAFRVAGVYQ
ncbi:MAG: ABC transporter permease, partial [Cyclobacteriaceae bacterium]